MDFPQLPRHQLRYDSPSPIHSFRNHPSAETSPNASSPVQIWVKREDQSSPMVCCGNKYRKLEYIIPDILAQDSPKVTTIVTEGGIQSNHAAQVAAVAAKLGLECILLLDDKSNGPAAEGRAFFQSTGNYQIYKLLGAKIEFLSDQHDSGALLNTLKAQGKAPYWIPMGASEHPLGGLGYAGCAFEIRQQEKEFKLPGTGRFDYIFVACGSGSTLAGMVAGFHLLDSLKGQAPVHPKRQLIGIMVSPKTDHESTLLNIARTTGEKIGLNIKENFSKAEFRLDHRFIGTGYGVFDRDTEHGLQHVARTESVLMDPVYSGKGVRGMMHWVDSGELQEDSIRVGHKCGSPVNVLFMHTGGQTVFSAYAS